MNVSENSLVSWSNGPGQTEANKAANAENAVRKAIKADAALSNLDISVFTQGSYRARTNVRQDSDVDVCVRYNTNFFPDYPDGTTKETFGNVDGTLSYASFKDMVGAALTAYFGKSDVTRGDKAFDVHENTYRIDADVVPTFEHRKYTGNKNAGGMWTYFSGVAFRPDKGGLIKNWPQQNYDNGVKRNSETGRVYKRTIRILKRLRYTMEDDNVGEASDIASYLIECLVWNCPFDAFRQDTYTAVLRYVIAYLWDKTRIDDECSGWGEVNELKRLFRNSQPWKLSQVNSFLRAAWDYMGYK